MTDHYTRALPDVDPAETKEWLDSLDALAAVQGNARARYVIARLIEHADDLNLGLPPLTKTPHINTIPPDAQPFIPGDENIERRIRAFIRWNAAAMVVRANKDTGVGGHLSTYASSSSLYEVGFNHFFKGKADGQPGDHVYFQGHAAPGVYSRAFIEGRLTEEHLDNFRQEVGGNGLSSYPHPRLMPDFWEFPTVSMGLGPINSIYHARFNRYMEHRRIDDTSNSNIWAFVGDGETDEPETLGAISLAGRAGLDNLTWVVNCNLQRLDGPVRGNGRIVEELEGVFRGAGWNVIKVLWGTKWDELLAADTDNVLVDKFNNTVDGQYQRLVTESGAYIREHFFGPDPRLRKLVEHLSDDELRTLPRGGHDYQKVFAAFKAAEDHRGQPTVILAQTVKGWTLGEGFEGRNATHQIKKMSVEQMQVLRERLDLVDEIPLEDLDDGLPPYFRPAPDSVEAKYMLERQQAMDGPVPSRVVRDRRPLRLPDPKIFADFDDGSGGRAVSTTMAATAMLRSLLRDDAIGERIVPIVADEARTFGMDSLFREFKIYAHEGQLYEPVDHDLLLSYAEGRDGQILEEGITEAGSVADWIAAATSYANLGVPMVPIYTFYSMFGFQRVGDLLWSAADSRARGFLLGATAGRTTLEGEGLQHQDGHSLLLASTVPACEAYDPAFAYELATILKCGLARMYPETGSQDGDDVYYYVTLYNENYEQPPQADNVSDEDIMSGLYRFDTRPPGTEHSATILFSGSSHTAARWAREELAAKYGVGAELWSVTSYKTLREQALDAERWERLNPGEARTIEVTEKLTTSEGPIVAVSDFMTIVPDQISRWTPRNFVPLGTDGFGRSDTRDVLRTFFEVDGPNVVVTVLSSLANEGVISTDVVTQAIVDYGIDNTRTNPFQFETGPALPANR